MVTLINVVAMNALSKLQDFLELPEVDNPPDVCDSLDDSICMKIENGSFVWDGDLDHPHINDFNLTLNLFANVDISKVKWLKFIFVCNMERCYWHHQVHHVRERYNKCSLEHTPSLWSDYNCESY